MKITDKAIEIFKQKSERLSHPKDLGFRLTFEGVGWGGPRIGVVLDELQKEDNIKDISGIKVAVGKGLEQFEEMLVIDYYDYYEQFFARGNSSC